MKGAGRRRLELFAGRHTTEVTGPGACWFFIDLLHTPNETLATYEQLSQRLAARMPSITVTDAPEYTYGPGPQLPRDRLYGPGPAIQSNRYFR